MAIKRHVPQEQHRDGVCPHCRRYSRHLLVWQHRQWEHSSDDISLRRALDERQSYYLAQCGDCGEMLLYVNRPPHDDICDKFEGSELEAETVIVWPELSVSDEAVPQRIRDCYEEAVAVRARSPNSFATSVRRALEALCDDRGITKGSLAKRVQLLTLANELPPPLLEIADVLRFVGNVGAHNDRKVSKAEVEVIDKCFRLLIEYFYEVPGKIRQLKQTLAELEEGTLSDPEIDRKTPKSDTKRIQ